MRDNWIELRDARIETYMGKDLKFFPILSISVLPDGKFELIPEGFVDKHQIHT